MDTSILYGERIYLRRLTEDDATEDYVRWMNDPEINQYLESRFYTHTIESTKAFIRSVTNDNNFQFGIFVKETGQHIGNIKIGSINHYHRSADNVCNSEAPGLHRSGGPGKGSHSYEEGWYTERRAAFRRLSLPVFRRYETEDSYRHSAFLPAEDTHLRRADDCS